MKRLFYLILLWSTFISFGYAQKGSIQTSISGGMEKFGGTHSSLSWGNFVQLDVKSYLSDNFFIINTFGYGFLDNEDKKEKVFNPNNPNVPALELPHSVTGKNLYANLGVGFDFLKLDNGRHRFHASLQGGIANVTREDNSWGYTSDKQTKPINRILIKEPTGILFTKTFAGGYDFYINPAFNVGVMCSYTDGKFGDLINVGLKVGYTF